uniref:Uncharacterized protein n=1 Tax=Oryza brachyantha TaxID=4533 RepID=J3MEF0_ORYBR
MADNLDRKITRDDEEEAEAAVKPTRSFRYEDYSTRRVFLRSYPLQWDWSPAPEEKQPPAGGGGGGGGGEAEGELPVRGLQHQEGVLAELSSAVGLVAGAGGEAAAAQAGQEEAGALPHRLPLRPPPRAPLQARRLRHRRHARLPLI